MIKIDEKFTKQFSPNEQLALLRLLLMADDEGITNISYRTFARMCGMSFQVCRTTLSNLIKKGELEIVSNTAHNTQANAIGTFVIVCKYNSYRVGKKKVTQQTTPSVISYLQAKCKEREKDFEISLIPFVVSRGGIYQPEMIRSFFNYWTEKNKSGTKMRFEMEKTWETQKRLVTWSNNEKQFNRNEKRVNNNRASTANKEASRAALERLADAILDEH